MEREVPFDAERKMMTIIRRTEQGRTAYCKGAPITDGIPALALAVDPKAPDLMSQPPRRPDDRLFD